MIIKIDEQKKFTMGSARVRSKRDELLTKSDWRVLPGRPNISEWETYRQALRDIPTQPGFPYDIDWPVEPNS